MMFRLRRVRQSISVLSIKIRIICGSIVYGFLFAINNGRNYASCWVRKICWSSTSIRITRLVFTMLTLILTILTKIWVLYLWAGNMFRKLRIIKMVYFINKKLALILVFFMVYFINKKLALILVFFRRIRWKVTIM